MSTYNEMFKATLKDADLSERASHLYIQPFIAFKSDNPTQNIRTTIKLSI